MNTKPKQYILISIDENDLNEMAEWFIAILILAFCIFIGYCLGISRCTP
jgi:hypothetical protein